MMKNNMRQNQNAHAQTQGFDNKGFNGNNRPAEIDELNFDEAERSRRVGDELSLTDDLSNDMDVNVGESSEEGFTQDDLTPETLIHEDGARSSHEPGSSIPAEWDLTVKLEVGGGHGLDEAELARRDPLDNKPWDGAHDESLKPLASVDDDYLSVEADNNGLVSKSNE